MDFPLLEVTPTEQLTKRDSWHIVHLLTKWTFFALTYFALFLRIMRGCFWTWTWFNSVFWESVLNKFQMYDIWLYLFVCLFIYLFIYLFIKVFLCIGHVLNLYTPTEYRLFHFRPVDFVFKLRNIAMYGN